MQERGARVPGEIELSLYIVDVAGKGHFATQVFADKPIAKHWALPMNIVAFNQAGPLPGLPQRPHLSAGPASVNFC